MFLKYKVISFLFYLFIFSLSLQTRWIIRDPLIGGLAPSGVEGVWEYGRISLYGWDLLLVILVVLSWSAIWRELKNQNESSAFIRLRRMVAKATKIKMQNDKAKFKNINNTVIPAPFGLELMAERPAGIYVAIEPRVKAEHDKRVNNPMVWFLRLLRRSAPRNDSFIIYVVFLFYVLCSILWSQDKLLALVWSLRLLEGGLLWLVVRALKPKLSVVCGWLAAAGMLQAVWGIVQFLTQNTFANKWLGVALHALDHPGTSVVLTGAGRWLRAYGGQVHPNVLGGLLVITCLSTIYLLLTLEIRTKPESQSSNVKSNPKSKIQKYLTFGFRYLDFRHALLLLYIVQLAGLFFTFSRGAWLALAVTLIIWHYHIRHSESRQGRDEESLVSAGDPFARRGSLRMTIYLKQILAITTVVFFTLGALYWQPTLGRLLGGNRLEIQSREERVGSVRESQHLLVASWQRGVGAGNYTVALQQTSPGWRAYRYQPVHNVFLLVLTELGIVGLLLFLWLAWVVMKPLHPTRQQRLSVAMAGTAPYPPATPERRDGGHGTLHPLYFCLLAVIVASLFDHYWWTIPSAFLMLWLIISLTSRPETGP